MQTNAPKSGAEAVALARYALISQLQELLRQSVPLRLALETVASSSTRPAGEGPTAPVAVRTLEDWWYAYQHGGFAALHPKVRSDRGVPRTLTPDQERFILAQLKVHPAIAVKVRSRGW